MSLYPHTPSVTWPTHALDPKIEREARRWVVERARRAAAGFSILAIATIPLVLAPFFLLGCAGLVYFIARSLSREGKLVPTVLVDSMGRPTQAESALDAWEACVLARPELGDSINVVLVKLVFLAADAMARFLAGFVPALIVHHHFEVAGKVTTIGKYMFRDEHFYVDEHGWRWALVHPRRPRLIQWPVSTRGPAPVKRATRLAA
jgi:hypothetical protein